MSTGLEFSDRTRELLTNNAWGDFVHDFDDPMRAVVTVGVLNQIPIEKTQSIKGVYKTLSDAIGYSNGGKTSTTAFKLFRGMFSSSVPRGTAAPGGILHENEITALAGIPYTEITNKLQDKGEWLVDMSSEIEGFPDTIGGRTYSVIAVPEKIGGDHMHMVSCLTALTKTQNIVIMWDAGSCEISQIGGAFERIIPGFDPTVIYNIFFINSKENLSDPAPKPTIDTLKSSNPNVNIYFLEEFDPSAPTTYPIWPGNQVDQNAHAFSGYKLVTTRGQGKQVSGTLFTPEGVAFNVEDIKEASKVANAVTNAVLANLMGRSPEEQMSHFFLKRAGDWCQALCLLDRSREYRVSPPSQVFGEKLTLADLESKNASIVLITNDRVLLSYGVTLGLNVVFTNVRNAVNWLIYFRNTDVARVDDWEGVLSVSAQHAAEIPIFIEALNNTRASLVHSINVEIANLNNPGIFATNSLAFVNAFVMLRRSAFQLARLPSIQTVVSMQTALVGAPTDVANLDARELGSILTTLRSANTNYVEAKAMFELLKQGAYPGKDDETNHLTGLIGQILNTAIISSTSDAYIKYQNMIDKLKNDADKIPELAMSLLLSDADVRQEMGRAGVTLGETRASRAASGSSSLGFLYNYYNLKFAPQAGGARPQLGGGGMRDWIESTLLAPKLAESKNIVQYTEQTTDAAYVVDETNFIAKDKNYIVTLDGKNITVVDGFINETISTEYAMQCIAYVGQLLNTKMSISNLESDAIYPIFYIIMKSLIHQNDRYYSQLLGLMSLEFSNPDALKILHSNREGIALLEAIGVHWAEGVDNTPESLENVLNAFEAFNTSGRSPANPDAMIANFYADAYSEGGQKYLTYIYSRDKLTEDGNVFVNEIGPQVTYLREVSLEIQKLMTIRDDTIQFFSTPLFGGATDSLMTYSKYLEGDGMTVLRVSPFPTVNSTIEHNIAESHKVPTAGGLRKRRALYSNAPSRPIVPAKPELDEGLWKRGRTRRTRRVRKQSGKSRRR
jgi:hypothetical protein